MLYCAIPDAPGDRLPAACAAFYLLPPETAAQ
jgi:hypothetical protein